MIHHLALEVGPETMSAEGAFWLAAGFKQVRVPESMGPGFAWYEREGTQIHLVETIDPSRPATRGHVAVIAPGFEETLEQLDRDGFQVAEARTIWDARRAKVTTPAGHLVELMEFPPAPGTELT
ncbi:MAG: hypothetical protein KDB64_05135 [Solirubrobacterales bacterium]|nr:hypothetical protein [Solirubrobacterales bacterium]MCB8914515.1 hypothetical protein [Thermoleophilales bacterium]